MRPVSCLEVKRCFVISDKSKPEIILTRKEFLARLTKVKKEVLEFTERDLDRYFVKDLKRLQIYDKVVWYLATVSINEIGVWRSAGGLPWEWTKNHSLGETSKRVFDAIEKNDRRVDVNKRVGYAVRGIVREEDVIRKEKYLYPIVLSGGMTRWKNIGPLKGIIDDGNMRAIAFAGRGVEDLMVYVGIKG